MLWKGPSMWLSHGPWPFPMQDMLALTWLHDTTHMQAPHPREPATWEPPSRQSSHGQLLRARLHLGWVWLELGAGQRLLQQQQEAEAAAGKVLSQGQELGS